MRAVRAEMRLAERSVLFRRGARRTLLSVGRIFQHNITSLTFLTPLFYRCTAFPGPPRAAPRGADPPFPRTPPQRRPAPPQHAAKQTPPGTFFPSPFPSHPPPCRRTPRCGAAAPGTRRRAPPPLPHGPGSAPAGAAGGDTGSAPERRPPPAPPRADSAFRAARLQAGIWALPAAALPSPPRPSSPLPLSLPPPPSRLRTPAPLSLSISRSLCLNMSQDGGQCGIDVSILEAL